jgi:retinol dehydrogenase-16
MTSVCFWLFAPLITFIVYKLLDRIIRIPSIGRYGDRYVLITGCDTGFGRELARRLDSLGCHVFAGCLTERGETELAKSCSDRLRAIPLDVTNPDSVRKALRAVTDVLDAARSDLWSVVNNAGVMGSICPAEWLTIDDYRANADVNLYGTIDVTVTFLPLIKRSRGRVVNMSSVGGRFFVPNAYPYCVSKYGVEAFSDGLRRSLRPYGCKVILMEPGDYKTNLATKEILSELAEKAWLQTTAETKDEFGEAYHRYALEVVPKVIERMQSDRLSDVTDAYEHAILGRYPRTRYVVGWLARTMLLIQALPEWFGDIVLEKMLISVPLPAAIQQQH